MVKASDPDDKWQDAGGNSTHSKCLYQIEKLQLKHQRSIKELNDALLKIYWRWFQKEKKIGLIRDFC